MWYIFNKSDSNYTKTVKFDDINQYAKIFDTSGADTDPFGIMIVTTVTMVKIWYKDESLRNKEYEVLDNYFKPVNLSDGENLQ